MATPAIPTSPSASGLSESYLYQCGDTYTSVGIHTPVWGYIHQCGDTYTSVGIHTPVWGYTHQCGDTYTSVGMHTPVWGCIHQCGDTNAIFRYTSQQTDNSSLPSVGRKIECHTQPLLTSLYILFVEIVALFHCTEPSILSDGPGTLRVHSGVGTTREGVFPRDFLLNVDHIFHCI